jgi:hypothetical protein
MLRHWLHRASSPSRAPAMPMMGCSLQTTTARGSSVLYRQGILICWLHIIVLSDWIAESCELPELKLWRSMLDDSYFHVFDIWSGHYKLQNCVRLLTIVLLRCFVWFTLNIGDWFVLNIFRLNQPGLQTETKGRIHLCILMGAMGEGMGRGRLLPSADEQKIFQRADLAATPSSCIAVLALAQGD